MEKIPIAPQNDFSLFLIPDERYHIKKSGVVNGAHSYTLYFTILFQDMKP